MSTFTDGSYEEAQAPILIFDRHGNNQASFVRTQNWQTFWEDVIVACAMYVDDYTEEVTIIFVNGSSVGISDMLEFTKYTALAEIFEDAKLRN